MALKPLTERIPDHGELIDREFVPTFNPKTSLFEIKVENTVVAFGLTLDNLETSLRSWAEKQRETHAQNLKSRTPVIAIRWADRLEYDIGHKSHGDRHVPIPLIGFSAALRYRSADGILFMNETGPEKDQGSAEVEIPDTPAARAFIDAIMERLQTIDTMIKSVISAQTLTEITSQRHAVAVLDAPVQTAHALITPEIWDVPPAKAKASQQSGTIVSTCKHHLVHNGAWVTKQFSIRLNEETGTFSVNHPAWFRVPGASVGASVPACEFAFKSAVEEHNSRTIMTDGLHVMCVKHMSTTTATADGLRRPFPQSRPTPETVIALSYEHMWVFKGKTWRPAWDTYDDVADLARRGQTNQMTLAGTAEGDVYMNWSPVAEGLLMDAEEGILRVNAMIKQAIDAGFEIPTRRADPLLEIGEGPQ